jgi:hypothetical protein
MSLAIDYRLAGAGWADCTVKCSSAACELSASYLSDALGNLVLAAVGVLAGHHSVSVGFDEEPGEYRWSITRIGNDQVHLCVLSFNELWGNRPDTEGEMLLECDLHPLQFGEAVQAAARAVLTKHGVAGFKEKWGEHDFPTKQFELLDEYVSRWQANR